MADGVEGTMLAQAGTPVHLARRNSAETFGWNKPKAAVDLDDARRRLAELQHVFYADGRRALLVVLQAMDAAGKDGTIRHVMTGFNPTGVRVQNFKVPAGAEAHHDYLWRVHAACPSRGDIAVFNRSHYEDVLVGRVKELVPEKRWRARYAHIRAFEQMLVDEGTAIVKIHLQISKDEQRQRLQARIDDPTDRWKFRAGDLSERSLWPRYMEAYEDAINQTTTTHAPWYVVPADRKWVRNLAVARIMVHTLDELHPRFPEPDDGVVGTVVV